MFFLPITPKVLRNLIIDASLSLGQSDNLQKQLHVLNSSETH